MLTLPAHIARIQTLADGSWRLVLDLGELNPSVVGELGKLPNRAVCIAITLADGFDDEEQEALNELGKQRKGGKKRKNVWDKY